ncbi:MAG: hypothetical protein A3E78_11870 [Alphaproteobacteria bacterium RIFCSPHIGHO2_12_FULL_63_12]|nr:MAG: hypothetical protein A3E78_11870 [Alphaproteobacteria bacterium RIFCSPHIGHO2_12_FULL_63_12]
MAKQACLHHGSVSQHKKPASRGVWVQGQCRLCRAAIGPRVLVDRNSSLATAAPPWLPKLASPTRKKRAYGALLKSKRWQVLRLERLSLDGYICQSCGGVADQVHHLPSAVYGAEELSDLVSCCSTCNLEERSARITKAVLG